MKFAQAMNEIQLERRSVGFDSYDITVKQLIDMVIEHHVHISPDYQRRFVWDSIRQSQLIESILLGIPIPSLFMATNEDSTWEVIDGLQRLTTLIHFVDPDGYDGQAHKDRPLSIKGLEKIPSLNGARYRDLPPSIQLSFLTRPVRVTVLNDRSDYQVRFDLFERLNTGGIILHEQEIRNCVFQGPFNDFVKECASDPRLDHIIRRSDKAGRGNVEELVLKFFAYFENRDQFKHSVKDFLNDYMKFKSDMFRNRSKLTNVFEDSITVLQQCLPDGIVRSNRPNVTPLILFEAIAIGVADVVSAGGTVNCAVLRQLLDDEELKRLTTGATNSYPKLRDRISFVADRVRL